MKNQQIHQQDLKITELEKIVGFKFLLGWIFLFFFPSSQTKLCTDVLAPVLKNLMWRPSFPVFFEQAEKNVYLEERVQVLQQQNEDLKERIDKNVAVSRSEKLGRSI